MKILPIVNVGSLEKRSNQPKYKEPRTRNERLLQSWFKTTRIVFYITIFRLASVLCIIECPVQLIREVFLEIAFVSTHFYLVLRRLLMSCFTLTRYLTWWFTCPRRSSSKRLLWSAICLRKVYIFQGFAVGLTIDLCLFNLPKRSKSRVKFYFGLSLYIFQHGSWKIKNK